MISPLEIQKGSILCHEGKPKIVKAIGDYILFTDAKAWIGGSMIEGEPLSAAWIERLGFHSTGDGNWANGVLAVSLLSDGTFAINGCMKFYQYVHQLQLVYFAITGEHLKVPKFK